MLFLQTFEECDYKKWKKKKKKKKNKKERGICVIKAQNQANKSAGKTLPSLRPQSRVPSLSDLQLHKRVSKPLSLSLSLSLSYNDIFSLRLKFSDLKAAGESSNEWRRKEAGPPWPAELQEAEANPHRRGRARVQVRLRSLLGRRQAPRMVAHILSRKSILVSIHQFHLYVYISC